MKWLLLALFATIASGYASVTTARPYQVDNAASRLAFSAKLDGRTFNGTFSRWTAQIDFDPRSLGSSRAVVDIQMGSARTGVSDYDEALPGPDWFALAKFPTARFKATRFRQVAAGRFIADGELTIRNTTRAISLPFTFAKQGAKARVKGAITIDRTLWGVGQGDWAAESPVAKSVQVNLDLVATAITPRR